MVLEDEPDVLVAKGCLLAFAELEGILAVKRDRAGRRWFERTENIEQRALPAARRPHDGDRIAARQRERNARQNRQLPARHRIRLRDVLRDQHWGQISIV